MPNKKRPKRQQWLRRAAARLVELLKAQHARDVIEVTAAIVENDASAVVIEGPAVNDARARRQR